MSEKIKIIYAIQGTGNGHVMRAREIIPILMKYGDVDLLLSGTQADINLGFPVKYKFKGFSLIFGKKGGVDLLATWRKMDLLRLFKDIKSLQITDYHVIINDFEPVAAWACKIKGIKSISLSHQCSLLFKKTPTVKNNIIGKLILKYYAPTTERIGFHFESYEAKIFTPVIRKAIREATPTNLKHYTVYLPAYNDEYLLKVFKEFPSIRWEIFTKHSNEKYRVGNINFCPVDNGEFTKSLISCHGLVTGAGFESPAEALYLGKRLICIPMKNQYEQQCNALSLEKMGIQIVWTSLKHNLPILKKWIDSDESVRVKYIDQTKNIVNSIFEKEH